MEEYIDSGSFMNTWTDHVNHNLIYDPACPLSMTYRIWHNTWRKLVGRVIVKVPL